MNRRSYLVLGDGGVLSFEEKRNEAGRTGLPFWTLYVIQVLYGEMEDANESRPGSG